MPFTRIRSGNLRHLFSIMKNSNSSTALDEHGREVIVESTYATVKGEIKKLSGNQRLLANQQFGVASHEFICWYVPDVTNKMWLIGLNGQRFNIVDIDNIEGKNHILYMILNSESS